MRQRNWLSLDRKLVDKTDLDFTVKGMQNELNLVSVSMWGPGVLVTSLYPFPFTLAASLINMNITVNDGIGFDTVGNLTGILPGMSGNPIIAPLIGDLLNPRWDLLVLEYNQVGDTLIPKPSEPLTSVDLNLHDDFILRIIPGIASITPSYPIYTGSGFILNGLQVPAMATTSSAILFDFTVRQNSRFGYAQQPIFVSEPLIGTINGINTTFSISGLPLSNGSLAIFKTGVKCKLGEYTVLGSIINFTIAPHIGEDLWAQYIENSPNSQNPTQAITETPTGLINGVNRIFTPSEQPIYQAACAIFIDGRWIDPSQWALVSSQGTQSYFQFNLGSPEIPAIGQTIEVQYWFNSWPESKFIAVSGGGGTARTTNEVSGPFTIPALTLDYVLAVDTSLGPITITLPDSTASNGFFAFISNIGFNLLTIQGFGGQTIMGSLTTLINPGDSDNLMASGNNWLLF